MTDIHACGEDNDSVLVIAYNPGIDSIISPISSCELSDSEEVIIRIKNYGYDVYSVGDTAKINLKINNSENIPVYYILSTFT